jgi:hypothetical protein
LKTRRISTALVTAAGHGDRELEHRDRHRPGGALRLPASRVCEVNRVLEDTAWGAYRTEFFLTYDYKAVGLENDQKAQ